MKRVKFSIELLHPKYFISWLGMGLWWLVVQMTPFKLQIILGRTLGNLLYKYAKSRKHVAKRNIELCLPELNAQERDQLLRRVLQETGVAIFESGAGWFWPNWRFKNKYIINGTDHIRAAQTANKGVLFLGIHFTTIEIGASIVNLEFPISGFYRPHTNAIYEYVQAVGRIRRNKKSGVIPNGDVRGIVKALRAGNIVNYAPDQDYGRKRSVFAPFFKVNSATVKAPAQLASAGRAEIIPWVTRRDPQSDKYIIDIYPPITEHLNKSDYDDAVYINSFVEARVRENPEQYLWVHRRFKTRPEGEDKVY